MNRNARERGAGYSDAPDASGIEGSSSSLSDSGSGSIFEAPANRIDLTRTQSPAAPA